MTVSGGFDLGMVVDEVVVREFHASAPAASRFVPAVAFAVSARPVDGYLVGVRDAGLWGWWGPVGRDIAELVTALVHRPPGRLRGTPGECARRLRRATRHSHTGAYGVSVGAIELACWDLLGQRHQVPVWRLLRREPARRRVGTYATCFGIRLDRAGTPGVVAELRTVWPVQKWRPVRALGRADGAAVRAARAAGAHGIALDFGGLWPTAAALRFATHLAATAQVALAFIEEPAPPGCWAELPDRPRPAPVAAGEHCYHADEAAALAAAGIDIWQPDAVFCGGFEALLAILARAAAADRMAYPHGGGLLPALHAAVAGAPAGLIEYHLLLEQRRQVHLCDPVLPGPDGALGVPELPGWAGPLRTALQVGPAVGRRW